MSASFGMNHLSWPCGLFLLAIMLSSCSKQPAAKSPRIHELLGMEFKLSVEEAQTLHEEAEALYGAGKYSQGFRCLEEALRITENSSPPSRATVSASRKIA